MFEEHLPEGMKWGSLLSLFSEGLILLDRDSHIAGWSQPAGRFFRYYEGSPLGTKVNDVLELDSGSIQVKVGSNQRGAFKTGTGTLQSVDVKYVEVGAHHIAMLITPMSQLQARFHECLTFFSAIQHNLRNPMATVRMLSQALDLEFRQLSLDEEARKITTTYMGRFSREIGHMATMLTFSRNLKPPSEVAWSTADPARLLHQVLSTRQSAWRRAGVHVEVNLLGGSQVWIEAVAVHQVLSNIVAIMTEDLAGKDSWFRLEEVVEEGSLTFHFSSSSKALGELDLSRALGQSPMPAHELKGNNLGLQVSQWLLEQAGGSMNYLSSPPTVTVCFPLQ